MDDLVIKGLDNIAFDSVVRFSETIGNTRLPNYKLWKIGKET